MKKKQKWYHDNIIAKPIFMKFLYNQLDLTSNNYTKFRQNFIVTNSRYKLKKQDRHTDTYSQTDKRCKESQLD